MAPLRRIETRTVAAVTLLVLASVVACSNAGNSTADRGSAEKLPPVEGTFEINDGAELTSGTTVFLVIGVTGAAEMRFSNDGISWGPWVDLASGYDWELDPDDGMRTVYGEFRNSAGEVLRVSDAISLDTTGPQVIFRINDGNTVTTSHTVTLSVEAQGVENMRFRNAGEAWHPWKGYQESLVWALAPGDGSKSVDGEFSDSAGNVTGLTRRITVDATPPEIRSFSIDEGSPYTNSHAVTLSISVVGATQMRFSNPGYSYSAWETYLNRKNWNLAAGDGPRTVRAQFRDAAGNISQTDASITVDTEPPHVTSFQIEDGATTTTSNVVTLESDVEGATVMSFRNSGGDWSGDLAYDKDVPIWVLTPGDGPKHVFAEYRDDAGNIVTAQDQINLDETRQVRVTITKIKIIEDGDGWGKGDGEIYYWFASFVYSQEHRTIVEREADDAISRGDGDWIHLNSSQLLTFPNRSNYYFYVWGGVYERDTAGRASCDLAKQTYGYSDNWGLSPGSYDTTITGDGGLKVQIFWTIQYVS